MKLINKTTNKTLAENIEVADTSFKRMKGLLFRPNIPEGYGLYIIPCNNIHSFFMQFRFDAIFIDKKNIIRSIVKNMKPGQVKFCISANNVVELPEGTINKTGTAIGHEVFFLN